MSQALTQVEKIALYLGKPWKLNRLAEPSNWRYEIIDGTGKGLFFRVDGSYFRITGIFPRSKTDPWRKDYKTIGVSVDRNAKDAAADITRRLMPHYLKAFDHAVERYKQNKERQERTELIAQSLIAVGENARRGFENRSTVTVWFKDGEAQISSTDEITLRLTRLTPARAVKIIANLNPEKELTS